MPRLGAKSENSHRLAGDDENKPKISVFLADTNVWTSKALAHFLDRSSRFQLVGKTKAMDECLRLIAETQPQIVILGLPVPGMRAGDAIVKIQDAHPACGVIVIGDRSDHASILSALASGARGCLLRDSEPALVRLAITSVAIGGVWIHPAVEALFRQIVLDSSLVSVGPLDINQDENSNKALSTLELSPSEQAYAVRRSRPKRGFRFWEAAMVALMALLLAFCLTALLRLVPNQAQEESNVEADTPAPHLQLGNGRVLHLGAPGPAQH